ncbi:MAG: tRNA preQ1(34) S-adenosylmethionine ribosyltransferase-isomerase QueA [Clostridia bacterium]|nr:tRNA preQ1(34) S-adenosylmethionine ribosyltransferase-isomerase QueA [Clostridia bacterium]
MRTSDFYYDLPKELIAQTPVAERDHSRMLVYSRQNGEMMHKHFYDLPDFLVKGDVLVINNTKVIPARLIGTRRGHLGVVEVLLLKRVDYTHWEAIVRPAKKLKPDTLIDFGEELSAKILRVGENGIRIIEFCFEGIFEDILSKLGAMPLPPYITEILEDKSRYQTVYCKTEGSAAAPTAGFHFTPDLLEKIKAMGVEVVEVLLHVGLSTFRPVKAENIEDHKMHNEYYEIGKQAAERINAALKECRRVICVGTTSVRTVESAYMDGEVKSGSGNTEIFIYPSYEFKVVKALITNFHLPESTLIMLVSAFMGRDNALRMYDTAVSEKYRFFSFGDATLIL